jgi:hypothetical protein
MLMAAVISKNDPIVAEQVTRSIQLSFRLFVAGAGIPVVAWGIAALEINRAIRKVKLFEAAIIYFLVIISLILFVTAAWRLPGAIISSAQAGHLHSYGDVDRTCSQWTDGCRTCNRRTEGMPICSNIGTTCQPSELRCTERPSEAPK